MKCKYTLLLLPFTSIGAGSIADLAQATLVPVQLGAYLVGLTFLILGVIFLVTSFSYWKAHRAAPVFMPLHKIITTIILAVICIIVGLLNTPSIFGDIRPSNQLVKEASKTISSPLKKSYNK